MFRFLPEQASSFAPEVDWLHNIITDLSVFFTVAIVGTMIYFAIRYRKRDGVDHETPAINGSHALELVWTIVPSIICVYIAYYGIAIYNDMRTVGENPLIINVTAQKWKWDFQYATGKSTTGEVVIPVDRPVKFVLTSTDVLHSFFVPSMRVKSDAVPGHYTYVAFTPVKTGSYHTFCTEYCGKDHSAMLATLRVVPQSEYEQWLADNSAELALAAKGPVDKGRTLYQQKGCNACHSLDGSRIVGPSFQKIYMRKEKCTDGNEYVADENYIRNSILHPNALIVEGYAPNMMPVFEGQLSDEDINALIAFMRTLDGTSVAPKPVVAKKEEVDLSKLTPAERGKKLYQEKLCATCHSLDGSKIVGPSFKGLYGTPQKLTDGTSVAADDAYLKESILNPMAKVVEGYPPAMPPYQGQLNDENISDITEFLKTVK